MDKIIIKSIIRLIPPLDGGEEIEISAELRIVPRTSSGYFNRVVGSKLIQCGALGWVDWDELQDENGSVHYLKKISTKSFRPEVTIGEIYNEFKKEQDEAQARFSQLMDTAVILERFIKLNAEPGDK